MLKSKIKFVLKRLNILDKYSLKSYSQCGEDLIIQYIINLLGIKNPSYIDIGANHPFNLSNTAAMYEKGHRGINIEANFELIELFKKARPKDTNLNIGIGTSEGVIPFYILEDHTLSTFSKEEADAQLLNGIKLKERLDIQVMTLNQVVDKYCNGIFPTILTIDVEGIDVDIIKATDFSRSKPVIICAETAEYSKSGRGKKLNDYISYIEGLGYYSYADTNLNTIFVDSTIWFG